MSRWLRARPSTVFSKPDPLSHCRTVRLIFDWDGTLTEKDTLSALANIGMRRSNGVRFPKLIPLDWNGSTWDWIVRQYMNDANAWKSQYRPTPEERTTAQEEIRWLNSSEGVESRSIRRVIDSGLFKGLTKRQVEDGAKRAIENEEVVLRDGWAQMLLLALVDLAPSSMKYTGFEVQILSINWSAKFIQECIQHARSSNQLRNGPNNERLFSAIRSIKIIANEIDGLHDEIGATGSINFQGASAMTQSGDKLKALLNLSEHDSRAYGDGIIYVGDSVTDLECLLFARVGIVVQENPMGNGQGELAKCLERIGISVERLDALIKEKRMSPGKVLFKVNSLKQIHQALPTLLEIIHESRYDECKDVT